MFTKLLLPMLGMAWLSFFDGGGAGDGGGSGDGGGDAGSTGTPPAKPAASSGGAGDGGTPPAPAGSGEQTVPYSRFKEVNDELQRRKDAEQTAADEAAAKAGDFEKVKGRLEGENGSLRETLTEVARRNAFYSDAAGRVSNLRLAYIAANELGLLGDLKVEINLEKREAIASGDTKRIIDAVLKENPELKTRSTSFGDDRGGMPPGEGVDVSKLSPTQMMEAGYRERQRSGSRG